MRWQSETFMDKEDIQLDDIHRILFGDAPASFLVETLLRTTLTYLFLLVITRVLGKRMKGQLSITEMAIMLMLGAIASVAMQVPDRGMLQGILLLSLILLFQRGITWLEVKSRRFERLTQGQAVMLVKDGILLLCELERAPITRQELFAELRTRNVPHLGRVDRVYFEACGILSVYRNDDDSRPGLSVWPETDAALKSDERPAAGSLQACTNCAHSQAVRQGDTCDNCRQDAWTQAIR